MYMCPVIATEQTIPDKGEILGRSFKVHSFNVGIKAVTTNDKLNGYKPRNNKLYTYPYNFLSVGTGKIMLNLDTNFLIILQTLSSAMYQYKCLFRLL